MISQRSGQEKLCFRANNLGNVKYLALFLDERKCKLMNKSKTNVILFTMGPLKNGSNYTSCCFSSMIF